MNMPGPFSSAIFVFSKDASQVEYVLEFSVVCRMLQQLSRDRFKF